MTRQGVVHRLIPGACMVFNPLAWGLVHGADAAERALWVCMLVKPPDANPWHCLETTTADGLAAHRPAPDGRYTGTAPWACTNVPSVHHCCSHRFGAWHGLTVCPAPAARIQHLEHAVPGIQYCIEQVSGQLTSMSGSHSP